jgi:hypothetical protein
LVVGRRSGDVAQALDGVHGSNLSATGSLTWLTVATNPSPDTPLTSLDGESRQLEEWLTMFHLASVVLDPYTNESAWILKTAARILAGFSGSDARCNFVLTCSAAEARGFLGPLADQFLVYCDPDRLLVKALGLGTLPAFVFLQADGTVTAAAEGWNATEWRAVADVIASTCGWIRPVMPVASDPGPFHGTPALAS